MTAQIRVIVYSPCYYWDLSNPSRSPIRPRRRRLQKQIAPQVSGGEDIHVGLQSMLKGEDAKLQGAARISKASYITTTELLNRCFPSEGSFDPLKSTVLDMGSGFGGTARVAAKELGCKVLRAFIPLVRHV